MIEAEQALQTLPSLVLEGGSVGCLPDDRDIDQICSLARGVEEHMENSADVNVYAERHLVSTNKALSKLSLLSGAEKTSANSSGSSPSIMPTISDCSEDFCYLDDYNHNTNVLSFITDTARKSVDISCKHTHKNGVTLVSTNLGNCEISNGYDTPLFLNQRDENRAIGKNQEDLIATVTLDEIYSARNSVGSLMDRAISPMLTDSHSIASFNNLTTPNQVCEVKITGNRQAISEESVKSCPGVSACQNDSEFLIAEAQYLRNVSHEDMTKIGGSALFPKGMAETSAVALSSVTPTGDSSNLFGLEAQPSKTISTPHSVHDSRDIGNEERRAKKMKEKIDERSVKSIHDKRRFHKLIRQKLRKRNFILSADMAANKSLFSTDELQSISASHAPEDESLQNRSFSNEKGIPMGSEAAIVRTHRLKDQLSKSFSQKIMGTEMAIGSAFHGMRDAESSEIPSKLERHEDCFLSNHCSYRRAVSVAGSSSVSVSSRSSTKRYHKHHGIGILRPEGVVFDDALLLRLAQQAYYSRPGGKLLKADSSPSNNVERRFNNVKIHVYNLLTKDSLVELPYLNCGFPIGKCLDAVNDAAHFFGTGIYHAGVEVNGIEYAFGANVIIGMSGIFTCKPKESPGYDYRETLDFGNIHTTRQTWIRIPKAMILELSSQRGSLHAGHSNEEILNAESKSLASEDIFRQIETFVDGNTVIHSMAGEYLGTDYDILRKNCCTFAHDVCLRLGVKDEDIPSWFNNAAKVGADAEDVIINAEQTVKTLFDCEKMEGDPRDLIEFYNHGFEIIADLKKDVTELKVVESLPTYRHPTTRQPLLFNDEDQSVLCL